MKAVMFIAVMGSAMPVYANDLPEHDCKKEWVQACVGSKQDKYRNWKPPVMHTPQEQAEIMKRGKHICEYTDKGKCAGWKKVDRSVIEYDERNWE